MHRTEREDRYSSSGQLQDRAEESLLSERLGLHSA